MFLVGVFFNLSSADEYWVVNWKCFPSPDAITLSHVLTGNSMVPPTFYNAYSITEYFIQTTELSINRSSWYFSVEGVVKWGGTMIFSISPLQDDRDGKIASNQSQIHYNVMNIFV